MNIRFVRVAMPVLIGIIVLSLIGVGYSFYELRRAAKALETAQADEIRSYQLAYELRQSSNDLTGMVRLFSVTGNPEYERQYNAVLDIRNGKSPRPAAYHRIYWDLVTNPSTKPRPDSADKIPLTELMKQSGFNNAELSKLKEAEDNSNALVALETKAFNAAKGKFDDGSGGYTKVGPPDFELARNLVHSEQYMKEKARIMAPLDDFFVMMEQRTAGSVAKSEAALRQAENIFLGFIVAALLSIALLMFFAQQQNKFQLAERAAAQKKAEDENETLNNSVISILQAVSQLSERDLTVKAPVTEDVIGTVSDSINALTSETARVLHGVTGIAGQVAQVSTNVKIQADLVAKTAEGERVSVNQMVESLLDATQTMDRVAALAEQSNQSAEQATQITDNALNTVNDTVKGMESIRETIAETEKRIKRLGERSQEISGIVNLINTISERTHVLALNASMQAAVAGEAGRGFAVVAEEVQRLAESSRNATQQIATLVNNIQLETNETISTVNQTIGQVVTGSAQAQRAGEQMRRTQEITAQLVSQVHNIAQASEQQKVMSGNLLQAVQRIGESTEQTAQQIEAQNKETDSLQDAAIRLVESVNVFKLPPQVA